MKAWLRHHVNCLVGTLVKLGSTPITSSFNVIVIGIALALPLTAYVFLQNFQKLTQGIGRDPQINVFLDGDTSEQEKRSIEAQLRGIKGVKGLQFVSKAVALSELARTANLSDVVAALRENPLPDAFVLSLEGGNELQMESLVTKLRALPKVGYVLSDADWSKRLDALIDFGRSALGVLSSILSLALIAVTFNTIRLQILTQNDEIVVSRVVGATDSYIQRPFFYLGTLMGLFGGLMALALVFCEFWYFNQDVARLAALYGSSFALSTPEAVDALSFLFFSAFLGWLGAYLSVSVHLRNID
ncbi:MAG: permease-like cell division protein FtsX [Burkholderiales bacterium]